MHSDKHIIVTGGSKGLGLTITARLLDEKYCVHVINRTFSEELTELKNVYPNKLFVHLYDLTNVQELTKFLKEKIPASVPIGGLVNNAALAYDDIITNLNFEKLQAMYQVNVFAPMMITKFALRNMLLNKTSGSIVHISSISVHTGYKGLSMYASTKGALEAFSKNTAREWGEKGIRSNAIVAGFMETEMSATLNDDQRNRIYNRTSLKKPVSKESVAAMTTFLMSTDAASVTGQNIFVDNGTI
jgi:3-oxoacyl-[acyl-carrier protein] reductase